MMELSVVVPTYNETDNIRPLCERLFAACKKANMKIELLIMDDESVGSIRTNEIVGELQKEGHNVRIHTRKRSEGRGLSSAVLLGFDMAKYNNILCMDADLQHEPESVPAVALPVMKNEFEFSVGSRHCGEGSGFGFDWALHRRIISAGATLLAAGISKSTDPMSGFFCCTKALLERRKHKLNTIGFKIGLEIMVKCRAKSCKDVPITFQNRVAGESKLTMKQNVLYVLQLLGLYWDYYENLIIAFIVIIVALTLFFIKNFWLKNVTKKSP